MRPHFVVAVMAGLPAGLAAVNAAPNQLPKNIASNLRLKAQFFKHLAAAVSASSSTTSSASATASAETSAASSAAAPTHTIAVGATGFTFSPNTISADIGDIIEFNFYPGNHSVVRSAFKFPCIPYEDTGPNRVGFFSGFLNTNVYSSDGPKYRVRVNDTDPIFYYCDAPGSCIDNHMIGVINPNATWTLDIQNDYTSNTTVQVGPGEPLPSEMVSLPTTTSPTGSQGSSSSSSSSSNHHGLSGGAIAGIVISAVVAVVLAASVLVFFCCYGGRRGGEEKDQIGRPVKYPARRRRRDRYRYRNSWLLRGRAPDGVYGGGSVGGGGGNVAMLAPISPTTASAGMATPASFLQRPYHNGSPGPGGPGSGPEMTDMGSFNNSSSMVAAPYPTYSTSASGGSTLPLYPGIPGQHPSRLSPLQSHPLYAVPGTPLDKEMQSPQTPSPTHQPPAQVPVELPAARVAGGTGGHTLAVPAPVARKESPTIGAADGAWGSGRSDGVGDKNDASLDPSKGRK